MDLPGHFSSPVSVALMTSFAARNLFHSVVPDPAAGVVGVAAAGVGEASKRSKEMVHKREGGKRHKHL